MNLLLTAMRQTCQPSEPNTARKKWRPKVRQHSQLCHTSLCKSIYPSIYAYVYIQSCTYVCIYNIHIKLYKMCDTPICISRYEGFPSHRGPPEVSSSMTTPWASAAGTWRYGQLWARAEGNDAKLNRWSDLMGCYSDLVEFYSDLTDTNVNLNQLTNLDGM